MTNRRLRWVGLLRSSVRNKYFTSLVTKVGRVSRLIAFFPLRVVAYSLQDLKPLLPKGHWWGKKRVLIPTLVFVATIVMVMAGPVQRALAANGNWVSSTQIQANSILFTQSSSNRNMFLQQGDSGTGNCPPNGLDRVVLTGTTAGTLLVGNPTGNCASQSLAVANPSNVNLASTGVTGAAAGGGAAGDATTRPSRCEDIKGPMSWVLCPITSLMDATINALDSAIQSLLIVDPKLYSSTGSLHATWTVTRNIALMALIPYMLFIVISTALGFSFVDPYVAKKGIPRLGIAALFILLSWPLMTFAIDIGNTAGTGIYGIMTHAFSQNTNSTGAGITINSLFGIGENEGFLALLSVGGLVAGLTGQLTFGIILSYGLIILAGLFIAFVILEVRIIVLMACLIFAPLAVLNDKTRKLLYETTSKLIIVFVLYEGGNGVGVIVAQTAGQTDAGGRLPLLDFLIKITAIIAPKLLLIVMLKASGTIFSTVTGMVNDRSKGLFDRQRKYRSDKRSKEWGKYKAGERGSQFARRTGLGLGTFLESDKKMSLLNPGITRNGRAAWQTRRREAVAQQKKINEARYGQTERAKATQENDDQLAAQTYRTEAQARQGLEQDWNIHGERLESALAAARMSGGFSQQRANYAARRLAATGTGYGDIEQMQRTVARVATSRSEAADMLGEINAATKSVGRHDLAPGYGNQMAMYEAVMASGGYRMGQAALNADQIRQAHTQAASDVDGVTLMRDKATGVRNMARALNESFEHAERRMLDPSLSAADHQAARIERAELAGHIGKIETSGAYASRTNSVISKTEVIDPTSGQGHVRRIAGPNGAPIYIPTQGRLQVAAEASKTLTTVNKVTGTLENVRVNLTGRPGSPPPPGGGPGSFVPSQDPNTGSARSYPNVRGAFTPDANAARSAYEGTSPQSPVNPYDPNQPGR